MKKTSMFLCVVLFINLICINVRATSVDDTATISQSQIAMPDLGISLAPLSQEKVDRINDIADEMIALSTLCTEIEKMNISNSQINTLKSTNSSRYLELKEEIQKLGAVKLTEEQALIYVTGTDEATFNTTDTRSSSIPGINYPDISGIDFYIFEYTVTFSDDPTGTAHQMAKCIALPTENANSKLVRIFDPVNMYEQTTISTLVKRTIKFTADEVTDYVLSQATSGTWSFAIKALWDLSGDTLPSTTSSNEARLDLTVSTSSRIIHYWRKINDTYYFRLATCSALVRESWLLIDNNGIHKYKYHEFTAYSKYHRDDGDRRAIDIDNAESYSINLPYKAQTSVIGIPLWKTKLQVKPFHAAVPTHFATTS